MDNVPEKRDRRKFDVVLRILEVGAAVLAAVAALIAALVAIL